MVLLDVDSADTCAQPTDAFKKVFGRLTNHLAKVSVFRKIDFHKERVVHWLEARTDRQWVRQLPNAITTARFGAIVPAVLAPRRMIQGHFGAGMILIGIAGAITAFDFVDGWLARRLHRISITRKLPPVVSTYGKICDPLGDKLVGLPFLWYYPQVLRAAGIALPKSTLQFAWAASRGMIAIELSLASIALAVVGYSLGHRLHAPGSPTIEQPGANNWGKYKFNLESAAILAGYSLWCIFHDSRQAVLSPIIFTAILCGAGICGALSIKGHVSHHIAQLSKRP